MFSVRQKREIAEEVQEVLRETGHPELPEGEIQFQIHVHGARNWSWANIQNNGAVTDPSVNPHNEVLDRRVPGKRVGQPLGWRRTERRVKMKTKQVLSGFAVVVLDRGFVFVGNVTCDSDWCVVENAQNIRVWGTTKGLGELVQNGPTSDTKLDLVGTVRAPMRAVIFVSESEAGKWNVS